MRQLSDTEDRDKYKVYGELIHTYGYNLEPGAKVLEALNYYNNEIVKIPLDTTKTPLENAQRYFEKYNKQKRTFEALSALTEETKEDITYLESVSTALDIALSEEDLAEIKEELIHSGYMRRKFTKKKVKIKNKPLHYLSSDGYHIYVGKNNLQNDWLTSNLQSAMTGGSMQKILPDLMLLSAPTEMSFRTVHLKRPDGLPLTIPKPGAEKK